ncbi:hypothetical protein EYF80_054231 [Liparis tanakae]|uniref:Uncharacterized protein n=1 Tax=Liparis tanakae TaxID=230148 RepID=A0A4Z2F4B0_9TELE|nr:hypothetical protein EYF80_054231 [Liparis tanakae]
MGSDKDKRSHEVPGSQYSPWSLSAQPPPSCSPSTATGPRNGGGAGAAGAGRQLSTSMRAEQRSASSAAGTASPLESAAGTDGESVPSGVRSTCISESHPDLEAHACLETASSPLAISLTVTCSSSGSVSLRFTVSPLAKEDLTALAAVCSPWSMSASLFCKWFCTNTNGYRYSPAGYPRVHVPAIAAFFPPLPFRQHVLRFLRISFLRRVMNPWWFHRVVHSGPRGGRNESRLRLLALGSRSVSKHLTRVGWPSALLLGVSLPSFPRPLPLPLPLPRPAALTLCPAPVEPQQSQALGVLFLPDVRPLTWPSAAAEAAGVCAEDRGDGALAASASTGGDSGATGARGGGRVEAEAKSLAAARSRLVVFPCGDTRGGGGGGGGGGAAAGTVRRGEAGGVAVFIGDAEPL